MQRVHDRSGQIQAGGSFVGRFRSGCYESADSTVTSHALPPPWDDDIVRLLGHTVEARKQAALGLIASASLPHAHIGQSFC
jgi:hypothetical protein